MANDNFSQQAEYYSKYRPAYPKKMYDFIFRHVQKKQTAWDCGTGSGQVASYLADYFKKVFASDISTEQLSFAPQKEQIIYKNVPAEDTGFPAGVFDLITVAQAIHWFDFDRFYREVNRTARDGATLAVIGYGIIQINERLNPIIERFYDYAFGNYFGENRAYIDKHYQTILFPFEEIKTPMFSTTLAWKLKDLEGYVNSWSSVQKFKEQEGFNPADDFIEEVKSVWGFEEVKEVIFPVFMRMGRIRP